MQLDTEDGDAFVLPAGIVASPDAEVRPSSEDRPTTAESETPSMRAAAEGIEVARKPRVRRTVTDLAKRRLVAKARRGQTSA